MEGRKLSQDEIDYMTTLGGLIEQYEARIITDLSDVSPADALQYLLEVNGLRQSDLKDIVHKTHLSEFLSKKPGARPLSKEEARRLGERFGVDPMLFRVKVLPFPQKESLRLAEGSDVSGFHREPGTDKIRTIRTGKKTGRAAPRKAGKPAAKKAGKAHAKKVGKPAARKAGKTLAKKLSKTMAKKAGKSRKSRGMK